MNSGASAGVTTILVLPEFPWPNTGMGQRSLLLLDGAATLGKVHVVLLADQVPQDASERLPQASSIQAWGSGTLKTKGLAAYIPHGALRLLAPEQLYRVDPVQRDRLHTLIEQTGAQAVLFRYASTYCAIGLAKRPGLAVLIDVDDRDDQKYETRLRRMLGDRLGGSALARLPLTRLARMLKARLKESSLIWFAGHEDRWDLEGVTTSILPNVPTGTAVPDTMAMPSQGDSVLFVGISNHIPNQDGIRWFLDNCWQDLSRQCPDLRLRIVGRGRIWPELAKAYPQLERVDFVGPVEDLAAEYARARLCICPVREGGGSKIKVVEAAAYGRPVIGVPHAFRGFNSDILAQVRVASDPMGFTPACMAVASDGAAADQAGAALRAWQQRHYSRAAALDRIRNDIQHAKAGFDSV